MDSKQFKVLPIVAALSLAAMPAETAPGNRFGTLVSTVGGIRAGMPAGKLTSGISGSGMPVARGTIDGFGSIFVNGVEFDTSNATIILDGELATEDDLGVGMVVLVKGTVNPDGVTGIAETVIFDDEVEGPITAIEVNANGDAKLITVLGVSIIVEQTGTVYENVTFETLSVGDVVEVSGFPEGIANLRATRVEKKADSYVAGQIVEIKGYVTDLQNTEFFIGSQLIDFETADLSDVVGGILSEGDYVEVYGTLEGERLIASRIETEDTPVTAANSGGSFTVQGGIQKFVSISNFEVAGVHVDASGATLIPIDVNLGNGVAVEVEGVWEGETLVATRVESRRGDIEVEASVIDLDPATRSITMSVFGGAVTVITDARTMFDDDTSAVESFQYDDLRVGDFIEIEAIGIDDGLIATRVDREDPDDEVIQAPIQELEVNMSVTLLGITIQVSGAEFEDREGNDVSAEIFFEQAAVGDLIKVEDEQPADGNADEVEFEYAGRPDGGFDFDDDDSDDDDFDDDDDDESDEDESDEDESDEDESDDGDSDEDDESESESDDGSDDGVEDESEDETDDGSDDDAEDESEDESDDGSDDDVEDESEDETDDGLDDGAEDESEGETDDGSDDGAEDESEGESDDGSDDDTEDESEEEGDDDPDSPTGHYDPTTDGGVLL